jgi:hypothetical protein
MASSALANSLDEPFDRGDGGDDGFLKATSGAGLCRSLHRELETKDRDLEAGDCVNNRTATDVL